MMHPPPSPPKQYIGQQIIKEIAVTDTWEKSNKGVKRKNRLENSEILVALLYAFSFDTKWSDSSLLHSISTTITIES